MSNFDNIPCDLWDDVFVKFVTGDLSVGAASDFNWHYVTEWGMVKEMNTDQIAVTEQEDEAFDIMAQGGFKSGQKVFIAQMNTLAGTKEQRYFIEQHWCGSGFQWEYVECGILFDNKHDAEMKTKELLGIPTETQQQREERERLEAIETMCEVLDKLPVGGFSISS